MEAKKGNSDKKPTVKEICTCFSKNSLRHEVVELVIIYITSAKNMRGARKQGEADIGNKKF